MPAVEQARELAALMVRLGGEYDIETDAILTSMDEPLGYAVGNALEVEEAVATLRGEGPADLTELCLAATAILVGDRAAAESALEDGAAYECYERWIAAQGGDPQAPLPKAPVVEQVTAEATGVVQRCHALAIGEAAARLGAGRASKGDSVDHAVGIVVHRKRGDTVSAGDPLATVHARGSFDAAAIRRCFEIEDRPADRPPLVIERLDA